jgi:hypothetical protein
MRKAQVTMFIILGIIILLLFLIFNSFSQQFSAEQKKVKEITKTELTSSPANLYVTSCIKKTFEQAIQKLAENGGWIPVVASCRNNCSPAGTVGNTSYGLVLNPGISSTPKYPCIDLSSSWPFCRFSYQPDKPVLSIYGKINLPKLQDSQDSIKEQLEKYTELEIKKCIDPNKLHSQAQSLITVKSAEPDVTIDIRAEDVKVNLNLAVTAESQGRQAVENMNYSIIAPVRLNFIYKFVYDMLYKDNSDLLFDPTTSFTNTTWYFGGMTLNVSYNQKGFDDLFVVTDNSSRINDKPLQFKFARQNLPPVLNYVSGFSTQKFDFVALDNQTLIITPEAFDPNEDKLVIGYAGWKYNYDEIRAGQDVVRVNITHPLFSIIGANATIQLTKADIGAHNFTVFATDGQYTDYQIVRVLVDDRIQIEVKGNSPYSDIAPQLASIEDPYFFEATTTDFFNPGDTRFYWEDLTEQAILYQGSADSFWIPGTQNISSLFYEGVDIKKVASVFNEQPATHEVRAKAVSSSIANFSNQDTKVLQVLVRQCLPHRSNIPPYPFNKNSSAYDSYTEVSADPFMGNHSCCLGENQANWRIAGQETVCYTQTQYGTAAMLGITNYPNGGDENDIYVKTYERRCDGLRGNMCTGAEQSSVSLYSKCDNNLGPNFCTGPSVLNIASPVTISCTNYSGASFSGSACSNELKCSNSTTYGAAGNLLCKGGCDGLGGCSLPYLCTDAKASADEKKCFKQGSAMYSKDCSCVSKQGNDAIECAIVDIDSSKEWCDVCSALWTNSTCCGDDANEFNVDNVCCDNVNDCVQYGICYNDGACVDNSICMSGKWELKSAHPILSLFC